VRAAFVVLVLFSELFAYENSRAFKKVCGSIKNNTRSQRKTPNSIPLFFNREISFCDYILLKKSKEEAFSSSSPLLLQLLESSN
jgi:hypothetical protein